MIREENAIMHAPELVETSPRLACRHCRLPIKKGQEICHKNELFCCSGCRTVYEVLSGSGLEKYYELQSLDSTYSPAPVPRFGGRYNFLDDQSFQDKHLFDSPCGKRFNAFCEGIHCTACIWLLEKMPQLKPGITTVRVDFPRKVIDVSFDPAMISLSKVAEALDSFGYAPVILDPTQVIAADKGISRELLLRLGVAAVSAANIMMLSVSLYQGGFSLSERAIESVLGWGSFVLALPSVLFSARPFFKGAFSALRLGIPHLDLPLALGIIIGFVLSTFNLISGSGVIYYDSLTVLIFLLLCGRVLQERSLSKIKMSSGIAQSLLPSAAQKIGADGSESQVYVGSLFPGDLIMVRDGEVIPTDGSLMSSAGHVNLSVLTGESVPVSIKQGDLVWAGTKIIGQHVKIKVEKVGAETRIGTLLKKVEEKITQEPFRGLTMEKLTKRFLCVLMLAAFFTIIMFMHEGVDSVLNRLLALFVVTCPCALGLAAPLTFTTAIFKAAAKGIIIKGGDVIENITRIKKVFFDKTGTLTDGVMSVNSCLVPSLEGGWIPLDSREPNPDIQKSLKLALEFETESRHPVGRAIRLFCENIVSAPSSELVSRSDLPKGLSGQDRNGSNWSIRALENRENEEFVSNKISLGLTKVGLYREGRCLIIFGVGDTLRPETKNLITFLISSDIQPALLTGDNRQAGYYFGEAAGMAKSNIFADRSPEQKAALVRESSCRTPTAMVGDGVNDTAALTEATVGIGVQGGAEACLKVADVFFSQPGVDNLINLWNGSFRTMSILKRCIIFSLVYNLVTGLGAIFGVIGPLEAAVLMPFSSVTVILLSSRGHSFS